MTVKRATQRQRIERKVETRFVLWSRCRYMMVFSMSNNCDEAAYHRHESNSLISKTQKRNSDAAS